jgi:GxxExxY protein
MSIFALCDQIRETSFALHRYLRHGHLEKVSENGLTHRLRNQGLTGTQQQRLCIKDEDGTVLGDFSADLVVGDSLIVEPKACRNLADEHTAQLLGYPRAPRVEHGLLISFGSSRLQIRKFAMSDV